MKISLLRRAALFTTALSITTPNDTEAATFSADFNSGPPSGTALYGTSVIEPTGGINNSGVLKITKAVNAESGAFIIEDLDAGAVVYGFDAVFKARVGGGSATPADGFSFNFAPDLPDGPLSEEGAGTGFTIAFDIFDNGNAEAPSIDVKIGEQVVGTRPMNIAGISTGNEFTDVKIQLKPNGVLNMAYKGSVVYTNFVLPNFQGITGRFGLGGRTGGLNANQWIDDLQITTFLRPETAISQQPLSQTVLQGQSATFTAQITNPEGATFQWFKNGTPIPGATSQSYTIPAVSTVDHSTTYTVQVTGPNNTVTSDEAALSVIDIPVPAAPKLSLDFNDGTAPAGTFVSGTSFVDVSGGANDSGVLKITLNENSQAGAFIIEDIDAGAPVYGFTAKFDVLVGGGTTPPADGFSFNVSTNISDAPTGEMEEGIGNGITVGFDIYDNGGGEAPSIDIKFLNQVIASKKLPLSSIETGDTFGQVLIRLETDGTMDVAYRGMVIHENVYIPGFTSIAGARIALGARTGGSNANMWVDNLQLSTVLTPGDFRITGQPASQAVLVGKPASFSATFNDTNGASFQWFKNGTAIAGATASSYTLPSATAADSGAKFKVQATKGNQTATSDEVTLTVVNLSVPAAPTVTFDFNNAQLPAATAVFGNATVDASGGLNDSGTLKLTLNENGQTGSFVINPLLSGAEVSAFTAAFDLLIGGGTTPPADGMSFNFASDLPNSTVGEGENGAGTGLTIGFDIYDNEAGEAPAVEVKYKGTLVGTRKMTTDSIQTGDTYRQVLVQVTADGKLDLAYGDDVLFTGLQLPSYAFTSNGKFGFYARTGGLNANQWVDNIRIATTKSALPLRIVQEPADITVLAGRTTTFTVITSDPGSSTYQWLKNGTAIPGATSASYTTSAITAADAGAKYSVQVTSAGGTAQSREAILTVVEPITVANPKASFNFDDGVGPEGTTLSGTAYYDAGVLKLTDAVAGQQGTFVISDLDNGQAVSGITAQFQVLVGGGSVPPADGFSFVWASNLDPNVGFGEDGTGTDLIISFDIYDNDGGEAPALDVRYGGQEVASRKVPISFIETGDAFVDVLVRVEADGTLDLHYNNNVVFNNIPLPGFTPITAGSFGFGGRTGGSYEAQWIDNVRIATSTGAAAPRITGIQKQAANAVIEWVGGGILQSADSLTGTWTDVAGAASPYQATPAGPQKFYRLRQ